MSRRFQRDFVSGPWRQLLALACILLVVVAGTVQVTHTHSGRADFHADCSLCAVSHITIHLAQVPAPAPAVRIVAVLEATPQSFVPTVLSTFALFTRPPPVA
jgi:hypothetical protein